MDALTPTQKDLAVVLALVLDPLAASISALAAAIDDLTRSLEGVPNAGDVTGLIDSLMPNLTTTLEDVITPEDLPDPWDGTRNEVRYAGILKKPK